MKHSGKCLPCGSHESSCCGGPMIATGTLVGRVGPGLDGLEAQLWLMQA